MAIDTVPQFHTITAVAKLAKIPWRTAQYWHDQGVIVPVSTDPVAYVDRDVILARLLCPFAKIKMPKNGLLWMADQFRSMFDGNFSFSGFDFIQEKRGYLVSVPHHEIQAIESIEDAPDLIGRMIERHHGEPVVLIDVGRAFEGF